MKVAVQSIAFLLLFSGTVCAQDNPYMPGGNNPFAPPATDPFTSNSQRQEFIQQMLLMQSEDGNNAEQKPSAQMQAQESSPPVFNEQFQELRSQQADDIDAITRERADREREIEALKEAFDTQIRDLQRKVDQQQDEINDLRYKNHN